MNCIKNERIKNEIIKNECIKNERIKNELIKKRTDPINSVTPNSNDNLCLLSCKNHFTTLVLVCAAGREQGIPEMAHCTMYIVFCLFSNHQSCHLSLIIQYM